MPDFKFNMNKFVKGSEDSAEHTVDQLPDVVEDKPKRGRPKKSSVPVVAEKSDKPLTFLQSNKPYSNAYIETNQQLDTAIQQLDALGAKITANLLAVEQSKTLKGKYNYINDMTSTAANIINSKIGAIKEKNKNGMSKQVGKSDVFTKESLIKLQDNMRTLCIEEFNKEYNLNTSLKKKQKGRNRDIHVSDMDNYIEMKKQIEKNTENLKQANKKSSELKQNSKDIKDKIDKLKTSKLNKDNYILSKEDKDSFIDFIDQVDTTNKEYDKIQTLSNTLVNANEQLKDKNNKIKTLTENNEALNLRVKTLNDTIKEKDNEI